MGLGLVVVELVVFSLSAFFSKSNTADVTHMLKKNKTTALFVKKLTRAYFATNCVASHVYYLKNSPYVELLR
ncbi:hypothetical protein GCM10028816_53850 [Spirosoma lituiforme]